MTELEKSRVGPCICLNSQNLLEIHLLCSTSGSVFFRRRDGTDKVVGLDINGSGDSMIKHRRDFIPKA